MRRKIINLLAVIYVAVLRMKRRQRFQLGRDRLTAFIMAACLVIGLSITPSGIGFAEEIEENVFGENGLEENDNTILNEGISLLSNEYDYEIMTEELDLMIYVIISDQFYVNDNDSTYAIWEPEFTRNCGSVFAMLNSLNDEILSKVERLDVVYSNGKKEKSVSLYHEPSNYAHTTFDAGLILSPGDADGGVSTYELVKCNVVYDNGETYEVGNIEYAGDFTVINKNYEGDVVPPDYYGVSLVEETVYRNEEFRFKIWAEDFGNNPSGLFRARAYLYKQGEYDAGADEAQNIECTSETIIYDPDFEKECFVFAVRVDNSKELGYYELGSIVLEDNNHNKRLIIDDYIQEAGIFVVDYDYDNQGPTFSWIWLTPSEVSANKQVAVKLYAEDLGDNPSGLKEAKISLFNTSVSINEIEGKGLISGSSKQVLVDSDGEYFLIYIDITENTREGNYEFFSLELEDNNQNKSIFYKDSLRTPESIRFKVVQSINSHTTHSFSDWTVTVAATATTNGIQERYCQVCGYRETSIIAATGNGSNNAGSASTGNRILDSINDNPNSARITMNVNASDTIPAGAFNSLRGTTKTLELILPNSVSWIINGNNITGSAKDVKLATAVLQLSKSNSSAELKNLISGLINGADAVEISFPNNGTLPGTVTVRIPLTTDMISVVGTSGIYAYYVNETAGLLEMTAQNLYVLPGNYVEMPVSHNSTYILTKGMVGAQGTNSNPQTNTTMLPTNSQTTVPTGQATTPIAITTNSSPTPNVTPVSHSSGGRISSPKTGDSFKYMMWLAMMIVAFALFARAVIACERNTRGLVVVKNKDFGFKDAKEARDYLEEYFK